MKIAYTIIVVLVCNGLVQAEDTDSASLLQRYLGNTIVVVSEQEIRYCPDNTCEIFRMKNSKRANILASFVYLYLYHKSDYVFLDKSFDDSVPFRNVATPDEASIRKQVASYCRDTEISPSCILEGMEENFGISNSFGRYDGNNFSES